MRSAILGSGSLGMITGALITHNGGDCTLIDANAAHVTALNERGARITGLYEAVIPVTASLPADTKGTFDVVFLLTKQMHMAVALEGIKHSLNEHSVVVTLQNGIPEQKVADMIGAQRVIGGSVFHGARYVEPGVCELTTDFSAMHIYLGELDGRITDRVKAVRDVLLKAGQVSVVDNIQSIKYTKLVMNAALSGVSAALGVSFGEALENDTSMRLMAQITREGAEVMQAKKLTPVEMEGFLPTVENYSFSTRHELVPVEKALRTLILLSYNEIASMLQDIRNGKTECEIDEINGKIVQDGRASGISTPCNQKIVEIVKRVIGKEIPPAVDNLKYFSVPKLH